MSPFRASGGWGLDPSCPCDVDFVEYVRAKGRRGLRVFHFGSGRHHLVGFELPAMERGHEVLAITASRDEYLAYMDRVIERPELGRRYRLLFGDAYALTSSCLPEFDLVTLFHLGEGRAPEDPQAVLSAAALVALFLGRLRPDGELLFYRRSTGREITRAVLGAEEALGRLVRLADFESLRVYGAPAGRRTPPRNPRPDRT